jgi:hypothetical protein
MRGKQGNRTEVTEHSPRCTRCLLQKQAQAMKIDIFEWPLPEKDTEAKAAVFELDVPTVIYAWRETTYRLLADVFTPCFTTPKEAVNKYKLNCFGGVRPYIKSLAGRLQLASPQVIVISYLSF